MKEEKQIQTIYIDDINSDDEFNLRELFEKYSYHWKWFLLGLLISSSIAFVYLRYAKDTYKVSSTIFINDKESGGISSELSAFEDLGVLGDDKKTSIINETGVLKSNSLFEKVVIKLGINVTYNKVGTLTNTEIYREEVPFKINFFSSDSIFNKLDTSFTIIAQSKSFYLVKNAKNEEVQEARFGKNIKTDFGEINITPANVNKIEIGNPLIVKISPVKKVAKKYRETIKIEPESKKSSLLVLTLSDPIKKKAEDILNTLVLQYNNDAIEYKTLISENTDQFINDRINDISVDLSRVDKGVEEFKTKNRLTDINTEVGLDLQSNSELQKRIVELNSQIKLVEQIQSHIRNNNESLIPANLGLQDRETNQNTLMYNNLLLERNRIIKGSSNLNPTVINLESQLVSLRISIEQGLENLRSSLKFSLNEARGQEYRISSKRKAAPQQEREFQDIKRKQQIIESLYLYLLQKREENAISLGIPVPNAKIVDKADGSEIPVSPKPILIYALGALIGLFVPFFIISIRSLLDNMVHTSDDVEAIVKAPIIGNLPKTKSKNKVIISETDNSSIAESFRLLRTNVNFMLSKSNDESKTIFLTSTLSGEGKTFISINLASSLALINKRVLLIGADIRKPKLALYLDIKPEKGLTNFLNDKNLNVSDVIVKKEEYNFDVISSGEIPPNPSELLLNGRFDEVLQFGRKHYDYIIVDTAPVNIVTDTLLLGSYADLFVYIIRADFLDKRLLKVPQMMYENKRLPNMSILINDIDYDNNGYGYGYGYKEDEDISWWSRIFKK